MIHLFLAAQTFTLNSDELLKKQYITSLKSDLAIYFLFFFLSFFAAETPLYCQNIPTPLIISTKLTIGLTNLNIKRIIPLEQSAGNFPYIRGFTNPPIIALDKDWQWKCVLCSEIPPLPTPIPSSKFKKGPTPRIMAQNFKITEHYFWADGVPVTAHDVIYTMTKLQLISANRNLSPIKSIAVDPLNPKKFSIIFHEKHFDYFQHLAISLLPHHKKDLIEKMETITDDEELFSLLSSPSFYYGPYIIKSVKNNQILLSLNDYYAGKKPKISSLFLKQIPSQDDLLKELKEGSIDLIPEEQIGVNKLQDLSSFDMIQIITGESTKLDQITLNLRNPLFASVEVRKALALSIDRDQLIEEAYHGLAKPINGFLIYDDIPLKSGIPYSKYYDPQAAKDLLTNANWKLNADNRRVKNNQLLSLTLVIPEDEIRKDLAHKLKKYWENIGVETKIQVINGETQFLEFIQKARFRDAALFTWNLVPDGTPWQVFHSSQIPSSQNGYFGQNIGAWFNKEVDQKLIKLVYNAPLSERKNILAEIQSLFFKDSPIITLARRNLTILASKRVKGVSLAGYQSQSCLNALDWDISP